MIVTERAAESSWQDMTSLHGSYREVLLDQVRGLRKGCMERIQVRQDLARPGRMDGVHRTYASRILLLVHSCTHEMSALTPLSHTILPRIN